MATYIDPNYKELFAKLYPDDLNTININLKSFFSSKIVI
jgi:hypothetical protein